MAGKELTEVEPLLPESDAYHVAYGGNLYLINFDVNKFDLKLQHQEAIRRLVVPFVEKSIRRFGPGTYELRVIGSASATGSWQHNKDLAETRASEAGNYAIRLFRERQAADPSLKATLLLDPQSVGSDLAVQDPLIRTAKTKNEIEKRQTTYRSVLFWFKSGFKHPVGSSTFHIKEHYMFTFKKIEEPLPDILKGIEETLNKYPVVKQILSNLLDNITKPLKQALGPMFSIGKHMFSFLVPQTADYAYEIKDYRNTHALYRYHTNGQHGDMIPFMELLGILASLSAILKKISDILGLEGKVEKWVEITTKQFEKQIDAVIERVRPIVGDEAANAIKAFANLAKTGQLRTGFFAPSSSWMPFTFHDGGPDHNVVNQEGLAHRFAAEALFINSVDLKFGGPVPNDWTAFCAQAFITTFSGRNSLIVSDAPWPFFRRGGRVCWIYSGQGASSRRYVRR